MGMDSQYLGRLDFQAALTEQEKWHGEIASGRTHQMVLGFESEPVVTFGVRGNPAADLTRHPSEIVARGFALLHLDRGGQATLHHHGQLVIFPLCAVERGALRSWLLNIVEITRQCLGTWGVVAEWDESNPGLYTNAGKIMALGVRLRKGVTTHGLAINVNNDLSQYGLIRPCGRAGATMARMGPGIELSEVFNRWTGLFYQAQQSICATSGQNDVLPS